MPTSGSWEAEETSQGQGHQIFAKLVWHLLFFFLVYGNDHIQGSLQARQMATFPAAVFPERSPLARRLHTFSNSVFPSCRQGPFLKLFCLAQTLFESGSNTSALNILRQQLQEENNLGNLPSPPHPKQAPAKR